MLVFWRVDMKYKKIMLFFSVAAFLSLVLRFIQIEYAIDLTTGFYKAEVLGLGGLITVAILAFAAITAAFSFTTHRRPDHPPKPNIPLSVCSALFAILIIAEMLLEGFPPNTILWQVIFLKIASVMLVLLLTAFAIKKFINISIPTIAYSFFAIYLIFKLIFSFSAISSLALISDNILLIAAYCSALVFAICFAKLYNEMDTEKGFKKLLASGLVSVIICFAQSIPHIVYNLLNGNSYLHTPLRTSFSVLFLGVFILAFLLSHFSKENACE
jgi:hypothetical protein